MTAHTAETAILNPYNDQVVGHVPAADEADVRAAIGRAGEAAAVMAGLPAHRRAAILEKAARLIDDDARAFAALMAAESGKPLKYARGEVSRGVETLVFAADAARSLHGETVPLDAAKGGVGKIGYYVRVPVGVIAAITPFNFPLNLVLHKVAPSIAAGNAMVLKPAPATPLTALRLADVLREAGLPPGALEIVCGGADVGHWLTTDPRVHMLTFTGSPGVARTISANAGLRRVTLELGGNAACIVDETANLEHAVARNIIGGFAYSGQTCISVQRIYIHESRYAAFRDAYTAAATRLTLGDPADEKTDLGPVISDAAAHRLRAWVGEAEAGGARIIAGRLPDAGRMLPAVVLEEVQEDMRVMREEVFGPVVSLVPYRDFADAVARVNRSAFGLQAGVYTRDLNRALTAAQQLEVGGVIINDVPTFRVDHMPYGGVRDSGVGREGPRFAVEEMTQMRLVVFSLGV
jgi:acyl-CoA reductase-like NAD-dependent aldehyde dehydrogenase